MLTVVCIKVGNTYGPEYPNYLREGVRRHMAQEHRFVCITDDPAGVGWETVKLWDSPLPGWWAKLLLFHPQAAVELSARRILYLDLDTIPVGSLDALADFPSDFVMHQDFMRPRMNASAVMALTLGAAPEIWERFARNPFKAMNQHEAGGDQAFLTAVRPATDLFPRHWVVSYRLEAEHGPPPDARVICFHGRPKPHECGCGGWVWDRWASLSS